MMPKPQRTIAALLLAMAIPLLAGAAARTETWRWSLPDWLPAPVAPHDNPMSVAKVELGRHLFYDARLSSDGTIACSSCHLQERGFADNRPVAVGVDGVAGVRNAPTLTNVAYMPVLTWANPLQRHLEFQALLPLFGNNPPEMAMEGRENELLVRLQVDETYRTLFSRAFPKSGGKITLRAISQALGSFQRTLISTDSPYDQYKHGGRDADISDAAIRGEALFFSHRLECYHCHTGPNFTDNLVTVRSAVPEFGYHNNGLYNLDGAGAYPVENRGIAEHTGQADDMGRFRTPTLRNVALTAPYMHDGSIPTLRDVVMHYADGGRTITYEGRTSNGNASPLKDPMLNGFEITPSEADDLVAFLESLTDLSFTRDPRFSDPWPAGSPAAKSRRATAVDE